ncbi:MAG: hypothetical protein L3J33_06555 [Rhodobacteraceae bacterium]|nr:hypothetical protein [Paracoccaceae bacterium]
MTLKKYPVGKPNKDTLRSARFVYRRLMRGLEIFIERMEAGLGSADATAEQSKSMNAHMKLLQQIVDMENAFDKRGTGDEAAGITALDLDAAKREIRDRLSRRADAICAE